MKRVAYIFFLITAVCLISCNNRPSYVLDEDEMIDLLADMQLAEAYSNSQSSFTKNEDRLVMGRRILTAHHVSPETLDTTLAWYGRNLDEYSALFEKVEKEIQRRKMIYMKASGEGETDNLILWPYSSHMVLYPRSGFNGFTFSFDLPQIDKGDVLKFNFVSSVNSDINGIMGIEYTDGSGEAASSDHMKDRRKEMMVQSDTGKTVKRIYGIFSLRDEKELPLFIDSISMTREPYDSVQYYQNRRSQKRYGMIMPRKPVVKTDTVKPDSIKADSISSTVGRKLIPHRVS